MYCPRDHAEMNVQQHEAKIEIDVCPTCEGIWLDKGELETIKAKLEETLDPESMEPPEDYDFSFSKKRQTDYKSIDCPRCNKKMDTKEYAYWSQIMVDVCPAGCGLWLDSNELKALTVFFENNLRADAKEESQKAMWSTLTSLFGG